MPAIARKDDTFSTGHDCVASSDLAAPTGNTTVFANNILICRLDDKTIAHGINSGAGCPNHVASISGSSSNVYAAGAKVADVGDACDAGQITSGSPNVFANGGPEE